MADDPTRTICVPVLVTKDELGALDDFRAEQRLESRAAAMREVVRRGLVAANTQENDGPSTRH